MGPLAQGLATARGPLGRDTWGPTTVGGTAGQTHAAPSSAGDRRGSPGRGPLLSCPPRASQCPQVRSAKGDLPPRQLIPRKQLQDPQGRGVPLQHRWPPIAGPGTGSGTGRTQADGQPPSTSPSVSPSTLWVRVPGQETQRQRPELWAPGTQRTASQYPSQLQAQPPLPEVSAPLSPTPSPPHGPLSPRGVLSPQLSGNCWMNALPRQWWVAGGGWQGARQHRAVLPERSEPQQAWGAGAS